MISAPHCELLVFIDNLTHLQYAHAYGASAFCLGLPTFSFLQEDLSWSEFETCLSLAQSLNKNLYILIDIYPQNIELELLQQTLQKLDSYKNLKFIIRDPGLISLIQTHCKNSHIHLQSPFIKNWQSAQFWSNLGIQRVFIPDTLTLDEISMIKSQVPTLELALQVHGKMEFGFIPYTPAGNNDNCSSGSCATTSTETRQKFNDLDVEKDQFGLHFYSQNERCLLPEIKAFQHLFNSLWIDCRSRSNAYTALTTKAYAETIQHIQQNSHLIDYSETLADLSAIASSEYFISDIHHEDMKYQNLMVESNQKQYVGLVKEFYPEANNKAVIEVISSITVGDKLHFISTQQEFAQTTDSLVKYDGEEVNKLEVNDYFTLNLKKEVNEYALVYKVNTS